MPMNHDTIISNYQILEDSDGMRKCIIVIALDASGSMSPHEDTVYQAAADLLKMLAKQNETALDFEFRVVLLNFNTSITPIPQNSVALPPEQLLELFDRSSYRCGGGTSLAAVFDKLDNLFSRKPGGLLEHASKGDAYPLVIFISDYIPTDSQFTYDASKKRLLSNQFYSKTNRLCIYVGHESRRNVAAELVGSVDNVLALNADLKGLLAPVVIGSSIVMTDATHIGTNEQAPSEVAKEQQKRAEDGKTSAQNLRDSKLQEELKKLFEKSE